MRWALAAEPRIGQLRVRSRFAWLPTVIGANVLWLERFYVTEEVQVTQHWDWCNQVVDDIEWVEKSRAFTRAELEK